MDDSNWGVPDYKETYSAEELQNWVMANFGPKIKIKKLSEDDIVTTRAKESDAGWDLYVPHDFYYLTRVGLWFPLISLWLFLRDM